MRVGLVGSEMCIRDSLCTAPTAVTDGPLYSAHSCHRRPFVQHPQLSQTVLCTTPRAVADCPLYSARPPFVQHHSCHRLSFVQHPELSQTVLCTAPTAVTDRPLQQVKYNTGLQQVKIQPHRLAEGENTSTQAYSASKYNHTGLQKEKYNNTGSQQVKYNTAYSR